MKNAQFTIEEFLAVLRRRRASFIIPALIIITVSTIGAFLITRQYVSSTTILVQNDAVLNPFLSYTMAMSMEGSDDKLRNFNEIVYSRPTIEALIDSLGMRARLKNPIVKDMLISQISKNIKTDRKSSDSFTISYYDSVPAMAQRAVRILSELFIQTRSNIDNRKNKFAVTFYQKKLDQLQSKFEKSQSVLVTALKQHVNELPEDEKTLYTNISDYDKQVRVIQQRLDNYQQALTILDAASKTKAGTHIDLTQLYLIPLLDVPYQSELQKAVSNYDQLSQQYTQLYPDVQSARAKVIQLIGLVANAIKAELVRKQAEMWSLEKLRNDAITSVKNAAVAKNQDQDLQTNFGIYKGLYNEMKVKLEQAQASQDIGESGAEGYVVIDPAQLPTTPAKPNRALIIGGGMGLGLFLGILAAGLSELLDTRIRIPEDVEVFEKPIIAYLPAPRSSDDK